MMRRVLAGAALGVLSLLAACGTDTMEGTATFGGSSGPELPATSSSSPAAPSTSEPPRPSLNARGNIVKALGEEGGRSNQDGETILTFAIDSITPDVPCASNYGDEPENGHFTAIQMRVSTSAMFPSDAYFSINPMDFAFIGSDGITRDNVATMAAYSCEDRATALTSDPLAPGSQYAGTIMLDLPETSGILIYRPGMMDGGWEWAF